MRSVACSAGVRGSLGEDDRHGETQTKIQQARRRVCETEDLDPISATPFMTNPATIPRRARREAAAARPMEPSISFSRSPDPPYPLERSIHKVDCELQTMTGDVTSIAGGGRCKQERTRTRDETSAERR